MLLVLADAFEKYADRGATGHKNLDDGVTEIDYETKQHYLGLNFHLLFQDLIILYIIYNIYILSI